MITGIFTLVGVIIGSAISTITQLIISKRERKDKFRLAALDKRLEAHQEAYTLWIELINLITIISDEKFWNTYNKAKDWWNKNCLYLDDKSKLNFNECLMNFFQFYPFAFNGSKSGEDEALKQIKETGKIIAQGVELTPLKDEGERIKKDDKF